MIFDINKHEWRGGGITLDYTAESEVFVRVNYLHECSNEILQASGYLNKQDAIAIAKHFGLTEDWIAASESLPEVDKSVLIADLSDGGVLYDFARWNGEYWTRKGWPLGFTPSHWMPLPPPPQSKE